MDEEFSSALLTGCVLLASGCWALPGKTCRAIHPPHADQPAVGGELAPHRLPPTNDPRMHPASPGRPRGRAGHCPTTSHDDGQVQTDASAGPAPPAPASSTRLRLRQTTSRAWTQPATTPTPAIPAVRRPAPPPRSRTSRRPDTADAQRTNTGRPHRTPDSGRRTADTWTLRRPHRTPDSGPVDRQAWTLAARTGHWTPDAGRGRGQADEGRPASGPPGPPRRATARWDAQPCSCGRRLRRSAAHAGSVRPPARDSVSPAAAWPRRRGRAAPRRTAVLGRLRVERRANGDASSVMARPSVAGREASVEAAL
jgi:hypothetical protein